jgi:hypothetical protein
MDFENFKSVFIGLLVSGLVLLFVGMFLVSQQVNRIGTKLNDIQQALAHPPTTQVQQ